MATVDNYTPYKNGVPTNKFCFKADYASSEGANNVLLAKLYNDLASYKTGAQVANPNIRQCIDGKPIVIFQKQGSNYKFIGKYNFNLDKGSPNVFGLEEGDLSIEFKNNTSERCNFLGWPENTSWEDDFEFRFGDESDIDAWKEIHDWVVSTKENVDKFRDELEDYFDLGSCIDYYLFTLVGLGVDSRAKNCFANYDHIKNKWYWIVYDADTYFGINNEGQLVFDYNLEDTDLINGNVKVFNGQDSVFWNNLRMAFPDEIKARYALWRSNGFSAQSILDMFDAHQGIYPEAVKNQDMFIKYVQPGLTQGNWSYLPMALGDKRAQRYYWVPNRISYMDSKFNVADNLTDIAIIRGYAPSNPKITNYLHGYINVLFGSYFTSKRAERGVEYTIECPLSNVNDTEIHFFGASNIAKIDGLDGFKVGFADFSNAIKIQELVLGSSADGYTNPNLTSLTLGNNVLLRNLDCSNCINLGRGSQGSVDISGCKGIQTVYMDGTAIAGIDLPAGSQLTTLHLPNTITSLILKDQSRLTDLKIASGSSISTLVMENLNSAIDCEALIEGLVSNARLRWTGFYYDVTSIDEIEAYMDIWDNFRGIDEFGNTTTKAQISGTFHIDSADGNDIAALAERYPYVTVQADHITANLYIMNWDGSEQIAVQQIADGGDGSYTTNIPRASTAQYTYTWDGFSRTVGGALDPNALKNVTMDRYVFAHYTATVRTYTIEFRDSANGNALLDSGSYAYGTTPPYNGVALSTLTNSDGMPAVGWSPAITSVTGSATYYTTYQSPVDRSEITDDWDTILTNISAGNASMYSIGQYKDMTLTDGTVMTYQFYGIDKDSTSIGNNIVPAIGPDYKSLWKVAKRWNPSIASTTDDEGNTVYTIGTGTIGGWENSELRTWLNTEFYNLLPDNIKAHIVEVTKTHDAYDTSGTKFTQTSTEKIWLPDYNEVFKSSGKYHALFDSATNRKKMEVGGTSYTNWWLRSANNSSVAIYVGSSGNDNGGYVNNTNGVCPCFCLS